MRTTIVLFSVLFLATAVSSQGGILDAVTMTLRSDLVANDLVYDPTRDLLYASIPASAGFPYGNSIIFIDPATALTVGSVFVGSDPTQLEISARGERVYVGLNGANTFRWWEPESGLLGTARTLLVDGDDPAVADDFAIWPSDPSIVVVSKDKVGTTADGDLELFDDLGSIGKPSEIFHDATQIHFVGSATMASYYDSSTGFYLKRWSFDGQDLTEEDDVSRLLTGFTTRTEVAGSLVYATNGQLVDPFTLTSLGTFPAVGAVEPVPHANHVYFFANRILKVLHLPTMLQIDSHMFFVNVSNDITELVGAGHGRLAFLTSDKKVGVLYNAPIPDPGDADADGDFDLRDFHALYSCLGSTMASSSCLDQFDFDKTLNLTLRDTLVLLGSLNGPDAFGAD